MKLAHLILAHAMHPQLKRLVSRLINHDADVYIHVDKKADINTFNSLKELPGLFLIENNIIVEWGDYNMVQATLNSFEEIILKGIKYSHINLLSSQDYPLKNSESIQNYLFANSDKTFMKSRLIPDEWEEPLSRLTKYSFGDYNFQGKHTIQHLANKLLPNKKIPNGLKIYGRSQWFTITPACAEYVINYLHNNRNVRRFFRMTWAPDEMVFQTVLLNSEMKDNVVNDHLRFIKFDKGASRPKTLTMDNAYELLESEKFYARKFDLSVDEEILDYLDAVANAKPLQTGKSMLKLKKI